MGIEADRKVWVGGLEKEVTRGKLYAHFKDSCKPHLFEVMSKGTACVAFKTAEDAQLAIDTFNGSELDGKEIQVDVWTKKEKKEREEEEASHQDFIFEWQEGQETLIQDCRKDQRCRS